MGNQPDGISSNVHLAEGPDGNREGSYQFMGTPDSYITLPNNGGLDTQHSLTVLMWVYLQGQDGPLFNYRLTGGWGVHVWIVGGGTFFSRMKNRKGSKVDALISPNPLRLEQWTYVGTSYDNNTGINRMWVDGTEVGQLNIGVQMLDTNFDVSIGVKPGDRKYFKGRVARVQVYNIALNLEQVLAVKKRGRS